MVIVMNFFESPWDFESGKFAEQALVIILVLNLFFWLIVIIWRFCYLRKLNAVVERRRAEMRGRINDGLDSDQQRSPEDDIYALSRGDFPPSYDDAIKSHPIFPPESTGLSSSTTPPPAPPFRSDASVRPRTSVEAVAPVTSSSTEASSALSEVKVEGAGEESKSDGVGEGPSTPVQINEPPPPPLPKSPPPIE